jgi:hypothetical protein
VLGFMVPFPPQVLAIPISAPTLDVIKKLHFGDGFSGSRWNRLKTFPDRCKSAVVSARTERKMGNET